MVDTTSLEHLLALVGSVLYMCTSIPALIKVVRERDADAVSPGTLDLLVLSGLWWIVYSWQIGNMPSFISSCVAVISPIIIVIIRLRNRNFPGRTLLLLILGLILLGIFRRFNPEDIGSVAALFSLAIVLPTGWSVLVRKQPAPNASLLFWEMQAVTALVWLVYGLLIGYPILGATGIVVAPMASLIAIRVHRDQRLAKAIA